MRFLASLAGAAALFLGTEASTIPRQEIPDPQITDFRIWSLKNCAQEGNLGVWTITKLQTNVCQPTFNAPGDIVKSIRLNNLVNGCEGSPGCFRVSAK
ncbi:EC86 protein [Colletotrichum tofieldiae]|uniref:EC86 protein n=1 Tax=Colletotrichum tofieldiae TaxID=708197 RepID=A0A166S971_9PEZI|nr:EC86 protein [Colletotrichum tofieldiae]